MDAQRLLDSFFEMVAIESPSRNEAAMAAYGKRVLEDMGFAVRFDDSAEATGSNTGNLIAHLAGTASGHIAFSAHLDTVEPCCGIRPLIVTEQVCGAEEPVIRSAGDTILSADDKAGIAAIFEGIRSTLEENLPYPGITVLLTTCEEQSLLGSSALAADVFAAACEGADEDTVASAGARECAGENEGEGAEPGKGADAGADADLVPCFVLDADGHPGAIVIGAPYHYTLRARFFGKAAHAGVEPEAGISAIRMAARAIEDMPLGRIDGHTTANIGTMCGGTSVNVVAESCLLEGECRALDRHRAESQRDAMTRACEEAARRAQGRVEIDWTLDYPGIRYTEDAPVVEHLKAAAQSIGLEPRFTVSGGGADANVLGTKGACAITLGIGMTNFHSCEEFISLRDLNDAARYVKAIIAEYAKG